MPLVSFICPDKQTMPVKDCLSEGGCRMGNRCATRSYLRLVSKERTWTGKPSTTQLIQGTMCAFLKLTREYSISPDARAFMIHGTKSHANLEAADDELSLLEEKFSEGEITGISDVYESENNKSILADYKTSGSFKVAKALGFFVEQEPTGETYKSGKRKGEQKMRNILKRDVEKEDRWEWELQLSKYAMEFEKTGFKVDELRVQCCVRDGNTYMARSRGVFRNIYYFKINRLPDEVVEKYFRVKKEALEKALKNNRCDEICDKKENWDGLKCANYCEVAEFCKYGKFLKQEKESEDMAIKGLSEIRRLPRLGKIRLGIKKVSEKSGKEYPSEVDYFILDPQTPSEMENDKLKQEFDKLYGEKPKSIRIMFPVANPDVYFPQFYKRYGSSTSLKCKGDGETASCSRPEFAEGLNIIGKDELELTKVKCEGKDCLYFKNRECSTVGVLQILLPEMPGAGVWQITTGSFHSIVNLNSCIDYIKTVCGRAHMIPLTLERREQETAFEGKKSKHYILHINMDFKLMDLQKYAMIDPAKILLELPAPETEKEDILFVENVVIDPAPGSSLITGIEARSNEQKIAEAKTPDELQNAWNEILKNVTDKKQIVHLNKLKNQKQTELDKGKEKHYSAKIKAATSLDELKEIWDESQKDTAVTGNKFRSQALKKLKDEKKVELGKVVEKKEIDLEALESALNNATTPEEADSYFNEAEPYLQGEIKVRMMRIRDNRKVHLKSAEEGQG